MNKTVYLSQLEKRFERHFSIKKNHFVGGVQYDLVAFYQSRCGRTFISQADIIDCYHINEHCFVKSLGCASMEDVLAFEFFLKAQLQQLDPKKNHMYTQVTGVLVAEQLVDVDLKAIRRFQYQKVFAWYLKGWGDIKLYIIDLENKQVLANRSGQKLQYIYEVPKQKSVVVEVTDDVSVS